MIRGVRALAAAWVLVLLVAGPLLADEAAAPGLEVGFGRRSLVTERRGVTLGGYGGRGLLPALGVHDPTLVKAMVVRTPDATIALVTLDLIGVQRTILDALRAPPLPERVRLDPADVLICASHTHAGYGSLARSTGALYLDALFFATCGPFDERFFKDTTERVREAIVEAWDDLEPARIGVGSGPTEGLNRNRGRGDAPVDREIGVVRIDAPDGRVRGLLVNFSAHPTILGGDNLLLSAEWPGAMQRALEERYPGATAMFANGAEGDLSIVAPGEHGGDSWAKVEAAGRAVAARAAEVADGIATRADVRVAARGLECEMPRGPRDARGRLRRFGADRGLFHQVVIGDAILMALPGEPCARIGLDLKEQARGRGFKHAFVVGLAQDHLGYFVHADDYAPGLEKSHDYEKSLNLFGPEVGAFFLDVHGKRFDPKPLAPREAPAKAAREF